MSDEWKPIPGFEGFYEITATGRVRSVDRSFVNKHGQFRHFPSKELHPTCTTGYAKVVLTKNGQKKTTCVHQLVMLTFRGPTPKGLNICHNDSDGTNSRLDNLRFDTPTGNSLDRRLHGTHIEGEQHKRAKLTNAKVLRIRKMIARGYDRREVAASFGVAYTTVSDVVQRRTWKFLAGNS